MNKPPSSHGDLPGLEASPGVPPPPSATPSVPARPRVKPVDRSQLTWQMLDVERLIESDHPARAIWELVGRVKLDGFYAPIEAVEGTAGRTPWDPRLLVSLWIYAYSRGISSAREIARRCTYEPAFQWLCGLGEINHHTLSDFRVDHDASLRELFVQVLGVLSAGGLVSLERVMHDGTRIKACAGADSFRRQARLEEHLQAARQQVQAMADPREEEPARQRAARQRAARERAQRLEAALKELEQIRAAKREDKDQARASQSDPQARIMKQSDGGYAPGYNVQLCAACPFRSECCPGNQHHGRSVVRAVHSPVVRQFAEKMQTEAAQSIYRQRGAVAEFPNAWIKEKLGLRQFRLRGVAKVLLEVLWAALTYNIQQWIRLSWRPGLVQANN
jgi:transposase